MSRPSLIQARKDAIAARRRPALLLASLRRARCAVAALAFVALGGVALQPVVCTAGAARTQSPQSAHGNRVLAVAAAARTDAPAHPDAPCCATHEALAAQIIQKAAIASPGTRFQALPESLSVMARPSLPSGLAGRAPRLRDAVRATPYHARTTRRLF